MASEALGYLTSLYSWLDTNLGSIISSTLSLLLLFAVYRVIAIELNRLRNQGLLEVNSALLIRNIVRWTLTIVSGVVVFNLLGVKLDFFVGLWVLAGGTVIGFASMNTIGNAIAGLIIMVSRPFKVKDRLVFREQFVEVEEIDLIYTRMRTLDNVVISVPNQMVLETVVENQSFYDYVRRRCAVTMDYSEDPKLVKGTLLKAAGAVEGLASDREPYVWITDLGNFAMEYTLFYFVDDVKRILELDSKMRDAVYAAFTAEGIDLSTPSLIRSLK